MFELLKRNLGQACYTVDEVPNYLSVDDYGAWIPVTRHRTIDEWVVLSIRRQIRRHSTPAPPYLAGYGRIVLPQYRRRAPST